MDVVVTGVPLPFAPRLALDVPQVIVGEFTNRAEFEQQAHTTFGSLQWLWSGEDDLRFDKESRELVAIGLHLPNEAAPAKAAVRITGGLPTRQGGLRATEVRDFGMPQATVLQCDAEAAELVCLRDLAVLDAPVEARIGIAPGLALLVQGGAAVGWSLTDPARYLTSGYTTPDPAPPSPDTRQRLAECLTLFTRPLVDEVMDKESNAWHRLRVTERALRSRREDRRRVEILHRLVVRVIEDHESW
ncbi:hypothetical protein F0L17_20715 [Streptomyces sp. TRM43335]|uniref:Uncharacterized protein n=2 Tax=Streptomyces taklimakanensis TaxID=2569853 RepID=A0A6G2BGW4_9ACTN|nr:hypothetical protein [Streptomyces taklimakanensis]MTE21490.1 hypothetical protein [Streptomyces taklimakanensis]